MSKTVKITIIALVLAASLALSFGAGCVIGTSAPSSSDLGLAVIKQAWGIIFQDYVDKSKLDASQLSQAAIKGMVEALNDPHTEYLDAQTYQLSVSDLQGKFEGIGAYVGIRDKQIIIIAPIVDSPAAKAGIKPGDVILEIDGKPASDMSLEEAILHVRGPKGTTVKLLILHQGETQPQKIDIVRAEISLSTVRFQMTDDIAYIDISHFADRTNDELSSALDNVTAREAKGIILDLRSNPGGFLDSVIEVASHFLREGIIVSVVDNQGKKVSYSVKTEKIVTDLPLIVLTDNFSASASEVLAGALQDHGRAKIAGTTTFGKGSVNTLNRLEDGSALYITTARWLTPNGRLIEGKGIEPDYELDLQGQALIQWAMDYLKSNK